MTGGAIDVPSGFIGSPFEDRFFAQMADACGYLDTGRDWPDGITGYESHLDPEHPRSMPHYTFTRGHELYDGFLSIALPAAFSISYIHTSLGRPHLVMNAEPLPRTLMSGAAGSSLSILIGLPFSDAWTISSSRTRKAGSASFAEFFIDPLE